MDITPPYLLFLGDAHDDLAVKTASGILDWRPEWVMGQLRLPRCAADLKIPDLTIEAAAAAGVKTLVIGTVNPGGTLPESWLSVLGEALRAGMDIASGLHTRLTAFPDLTAQAAETGRRLLEVRHTTERFATGTGRRRAGKRLLTVGTDCSVGKKYAALAIEKEMRRRGLDADFRATGQTGIFIAGRGVAIDAVVADFISGAVEWLSPDNDAAHWDVIEGQGSLFHPSFAGVSLGLLHGAQPDAFVVCHEPTRRTMRNVETPVASISAVIEQTQILGALTNPAIRCVGLAINTARLDDMAASTCLAAAEATYGLPACDPIRTGAGPIVDHIISLGF
ncbi:MAG: N-acetyltransferase DgcN [Alphaproteobacteria bacterium]